MDRSPELRTRRLRLVVVTATEAESILRVGLPSTQGPLAMLHSAKGWPHADTAGALSMATLSGSSDFFGLRVIARQDETGGWEVIGDLGCHGGPDQFGDVEIGYGIAAPYRNRGYGTEAVGALVVALSEHPDVRVVSAETTPGNLPSIKLLEAVGFRASLSTEDLLRFELSVVGAVIVGVDGVTPFRSRA